MSLGRQILILIFASGFFIFTIYSFIKQKKRSNDIDSVADARVIKVLTLGKGYTGKPQFAITYQVLIDSPFEVLVTPSSTPADMGSLVTIYYDSVNHDNFYIPEKWKVDPRMKKAWLAIAFAGVCLIGSILSFF